MICIIGNNPRSIQLQDAAEFAGIQTEIFEGIEDVQGEHELIILNTEEILAQRQSEIATLVEKTTAPIAVSISLNYACAMAKDAADKSRIVDIRTM